MKMYAPAWSMKEYEAVEPDRLHADALEANQFYFLGLPNRDGRPDAFRALVQVENLRWHLGNLAFKVQYFTSDFTPTDTEPQASTIRNDYWVPDGSLKLNFTNGKQTVVNKGYFLPYEDPLDNELQKIVESLTTRI